MSGLEVVVISVLFILGLRNILRKRVRQAVIPPTRMEQQDIRHKPKPMVSARPGTDAVAFEEGEGSDFVISDGTNDIVLIKAHRLYGF